MDTSPLSSEPLESCGQAAHGSGWRRLSLCKAARWGRGQSGVTTGHAAPEVACIAGSGSPAGAAPAGAEQGRGRASGAALWARRPEGAGSGAVAGAHRVQCLEGLADRRIVRASRHGAPRRARNPRSVCAFRARRAAPLTAARLAGAPLALACLTCAHVTRGRGARPPSLCGRLGLRHRRCPDTPAVVGRETKRSDPTSGLLFEPNRLRVL